MVMGRNGHGPIWLWADWLWAEMTSDHLLWSSPLSFQVSFGHLLKSDQNTFLEAELLDFEVEKPTGKIKCQNSNDNGNFKGWLYF